MKYLTDSLIDKSTSDQFGHLEIAKEIKDIILDENNNDKSITIGIFGKWGVGKSSILQLLQYEHLKEAENNLVYIDIPIWKYNDPKSVRRKFIYQIANRLKQEDEIKKIYYDVTTEGSLVFIKKIKQEIKELKTNTEKLLGYFFGVLIISLIIYVIFKEINLNSFLLFYNSAISIAIVGFIIKLIQDIKFSKTSETQKVYESEEQFEHLVETCLNKSQEKKIFVIDDLDRCDSTRILSVFEVIKNFISIRNCVFLIACDPDVIRRAIDIETNKKTFDKKDNENSFVLHSKNSGFYLEKIFQYVVEIPGFLPQNMRDYAKKVIIDANLELFTVNYLKEKLDKIIYILIYKDTFNPRKVKTLINRFILNFNIAIDLEENDKSFLTKGLITQYPERLAFFTVLKSEFPYIIEELKMAPSYGFKQWVSELKNQDDFKDYFNQNYDLFEDEWNIMPFLYFNNDPSINSLQVTQLKNLPILSSSLRNGNSDVILEHLKSDNEIEGFIRYSLGQIELLNNSVEISNAVKITLLLFGKIDFNTIKLDQNEVAETKLIQQINHQLRSKNIFDDGLISYIAFQLANTRKKGIHLLASYLGEYPQVKVEIIEIILSEHYFGVFNNNAKDILINYLTPTDENIINLTQLVNKIQINENNYEYFKNVSYKISSIYEEINTEKSSKYDIQLFETAFFKLLKLCLRHNIIDFQELLKPSTPLDKTIKEFEQEKENLTPEITDEIINGIINLCESNEQPIIQSSVLAFLHSLIQTYNCSENTDVALDLAFCSEIEKNDLYSFDQALIEMLLNLLNLCQDKGDYNFINIKNVIQSTIRFEEDNSLSLILFNWIKVNYNDEFDPIDVINDSLIKVFKNPKFLRSQSESQNLVQNYFDYISFFLTKGSTKNIQLKIDDLTLIDSTHTLYTTNHSQFSDVFLIKLFDLMVLLDERGQSNFDNCYITILTNYKTYSQAVVKLAISSILKLYNPKNETVDSNSNEVISLNKLIDDTVYLQDIRFQVFVYRSLHCSSWWPESDLKKILLIELYYSQLPDKIKESFFADIERKLNHLLSPKSWGKEENWEKYTRTICNCFHAIAPVHKINYNKLYISLNDAIEYYIPKNGFVEVLISLFRVLNADIIPTGINIKKTRLVKNMRTALKKYKKIRKQLGPQINRKFDLKIGKSYFK